MSHEGGGGAYRLPLILCYHAVSSRWQSPLSVTPIALKRQMQYLLRRGYRPTTLAKAVADAGTAKTFAVTFDDAYRSVFDEAFPVLSEMGIDASLFVPTDIVDRQGLVTEIINIPRAWVGSAGDMRAMSWDKVRALAAAGWEIGSHTCSHPELTEIELPQIEDELERSKEVCETQLQQPCEAFAYPFGSYDDEAMAAVGRTGYRLAVTLEQHVLDPLHGRGPLELPRDGIYPSTGRLKLFLHGSSVARSLRFSAGYSSAARRWLWPLR